MTRTPLLSRSRLVIPIRRHSGKLSSRSGRGSGPIHCTSSAFGRANFGSLENSRNPPFPSVIFPFSSRSAAGSGAILRREPRSSPSRENNNRKGVIRSVRRSSVEKEPGVRRRPGRSVEVEQSRLGLPKLSSVFEVVEFLLYSAPLRAAHRSRSRGPARLPRGAVFLIVVGLGVQRLRGRLRAHARRSIFETARRWPRHALRWERGRLGEICFLGRLVGQGFENLRAAVSNSTRGSKRSRTGSRPRNPRSELRISLK